MYKRLDNEDEAQLQSRLQKEAREMARQQGVPVFEPPKDNTFIVGNIEQLTDGGGGFEDEEDEEDDNVVMKIAKKIKGKKVKKGKKNGR